MNLEDELPEVRQLLPVKATESHNVQTSQSDLESTRDYFLHDLRKRARLKAIYAKYAEPELPPAPRHERQSPLADLAAKAMAAKSILGKTP